MSTTTPPTQANGETRLGPFFFTFRPTGTSDAITIPGLLVPLQWPTDSAKPPPSFDPNAAPYSSFVYTEFSAAPVQPVWSLGDGLVANWIASTPPTPRPTPTPDRCRGPNNSEEGGEVRKVATDAVPTVIRTPPDEEEPTSGVTTPRGIPDSTEETNENSLVDITDSGQKPKSASWSVRSTSSDISDMVPTEVSSVRSSSSTAPPRPPRRVSGPPRPALPSQWKAESPDVSFQVTQVDSEPPSPKFVRHQSSLSTLSPSGSTRSLRRVPTVSFKSSSPSPAPSPSPTPDAQSLPNRPSSSLVESDSTQSVTRARSMSNFPPAQPHLRPWLSEITNTTESKVSVGATSRPSSLRSVWSREELLDLEEDFTAEVPVTLPRSPARKTSLHKLAGPPVNDQENNNPIQFPSLGQSGVAHRVAGRSSASSPSRTPRSRQSRQSSPRTLQGHSGDATFGGSPVLRVSDPSDDHKPHYYEVDLSFLSTPPRGSEHQDTSSPHSSLDVQPSQAASSRSISRASSSRPLSRQRPTSPLLEQFEEDLQTLPGTLTALTSLLQVSQEITAHIKAQLDTTLSSTESEVSRSSSSSPSYEDQVEDAPEPKPSVQDVFSPVVAVPQSGSNSSMTDQFYTPSANSAEDPQGDHRRPGSATPRPPLPSSPSPSPRIMMGYPQHLLDTSVRRSRVTSNQLGADYIHIDETTITSDFTDELHNAPQSSPKRSPRASPQTTPVKSPRTGYKSTLRRSPDPKKATPSPKAVSPSPPVRPPRPHMLYPLSSGGDKTSDSELDPFSAYNWNTLSPSSNALEDESQGSVNTHDSHFLDTPSSGLLSTILESEREYAQSPSLRASTGTYSESSFGHSPHRVV